jgi:hypothetical protein
VVYNTVRVIGLGKKAFHMLAIETYAIPNSVV